METEASPAAPIWQAHDMGNETNDVEVVRAMLAAAGIHPSEPEIEALGAAWPGIQRQVAGLYAVDTGDEPPASMLRAAAIEGGGTP